VSEEYVEAWVGQFCFLMNANLHCDANKDAGRLYTLPQSSIPSEVTRCFGILRGCITISAVLCELCQVYYKNVIITTIIIITIFIIIIAFLLSLGGLCCFQDDLANSSWQALVVYATPMTRHKKHLPQRTAQNCNKNMKLFNKSLEKNGKLEYIGMIVTNKNLQ